MGRENRDWGYERIQGALSNVGHAVGRATIADILRRHGIEPAPERSRKTTWKEFLSRHWELIAAADFFTVEVWTRRDNGRCRRHSQWHAIPDPRPRSAVHRRIPRADWQRRSEIAEIATTVAESECARGKIRTHNHGVLSGADDPVWRRSPENRYFGIHLSLPQERNHQGLENQIINPDLCCGRTTGAAELRQRLGRLLNYSYHAAA